MIERTMSRRAIQVGALVQMRKPHACGGDRWVVCRVGADIGIRCQTCGRQVLLPRSDFDKRLKAWIATDAERQDEGRAS